MESNLMMVKTKNCSVVRGANGNNNNITVRVPLPFVSRKVEAIPSLKPGYHQKVVSSCVSDLHSKFLLQNYENFKKSGEPTRFMSFRNGSWVDLEKEVFDVLKTGFTEGKSVVEVHDGGCDFLFDFYRMLQIDFVSLAQRSIAWMDVNGQPFFPKIFVNSEEGEEDKDSVGLVNVEKINVRENVQPPIIKIEIKMPEKQSDLKSLENESNSSKSKRNRVNEEVNSSNLAAKRRVVIHNREVSESLWQRMRVLQQEERGYKIVQSMFLSVPGTIDLGIRINRIHQFTRYGPLEEARFKVFQMQLELIKRARGDSKMVFAWYGGTANEVETVLTHGFRMPTKFPSSAPYGVGVYLSHVKSPYTSAMLSQADSNGEKHIILCRVILGNCEKVQAGSDQAVPSSVEYDTGVDDLMNPKWYIVWVPNMNTRIIPEYVVSFKTTGLGHVVQPYGNMMANKLFMKLRNSLPPPKSRELQVLCASFKEQKMEKDIFLSQLRVVVGDDVLSAAIQEIHAAAENLCDN